MNSTELLAYFRLQIMDKERNPYLWSDTEVFTYMDEAQKMFCRLTDGIADATTPEVTTVTITAGEITSEVHKSILIFRNAYLVSTGSELEILNHYEVRKWDNTQGSVRQMVIGLEPNVVRWRYVPQVDDEVQLLVYRLPLEDITDADQDLEIPEMHHVSLVHWMKHLAYLKEDTETYDAQSSNKGEKHFRDYCMQVQSEQERYKHKPRAILYGGL